MSVAGARAGSLLFDNRSFFLCDANLERLAADHSNEERILSCNNTSQEGRYGFESSNKEDELEPSEYDLNHKSSSCVSVVQLSVLRISS